MIIIQKITDYINDIKKDTFYAGDLEISNSTKIFKINIAIYIIENIDNDKYYKFYLYFE